MEMYLITAEQLKESKLAKSKVERAFDYITFEDMKEKLEERGYKNITNKRLESFCQLVLQKYDSDSVENLLEFLEYKGVL